MGERGEGEGGLWERERGVRTMEEEHCINRLCK